MNIAEKLLEYKDKRDDFLLKCSSEFEAENLVSKKKALILLCFSFKYDTINRAG